MSLYFLNIWFKYPYCLIIKYINNINNNTNNIYNIQHDPSTCYNILISYNNIIIFYIWLYYIDHIISCYIYKIYESSIKPCCLIIKYINIWIIIIVIIQYDPNICNNILISYYNIDHIIVIWTKILIIYINITNNIMQ